MEDEHQHHHQIVPVRHYWYNFAALTVLMILTIVAAQVHLGWANLPIALAIAIAKATLIILIFMDVRHGSQLTYLFAGAGFAWFLIMICFTITDFVIHKTGTLGASPYIVPPPGTFDLPTDIIPPSH